MTRAPLRFLVVEDETISALYAELELRHAGYVVCKCVATGEEAIASALADQPDVVLMDIRLAGDLDGIEAAQQIQAAAAIPIIFLTGYSDQDMRSRAIQVNPLGFFTKPIRIEDIQSAMASILQAGKYATERNPALCDEVISQRQIHSCYAGNSPRPSLQRREGRNHVGLFPLLLEECGELVASGVLVRKY